MTEIFGDPDDEQGPIPEGAPIGRPRAVLNRMLGAVLSVLWIGILQIAMKIPLSGGR